MSKSAHSRVLEQLIAERRQTLLEASANGLPKNVYYMNCGKVQGLDEALQFSAEADFKLSGEEPNDGGA